ncbi:MAG: ClpXP protease specificity-enhancing factor SspB, partial [Pseudomonadota bacterium]
MARRINYGKLMHKAMQGLLAEVLQDVSANGLPGDHHFYITFETAHPG